MSATLEWSAQMDDWQCYSETARYRDLVITADARGVWTVRHRIVADDGSEHWVFLCSNDRAGLSHRSCSDARISAVAKLVTLGYKLEIPAPIPKTPVSDVRYVGMWPPKKEYTWSVEPVRYSDPSSTDARYLAWVRDLNRFVRGDDCMGDIGHRAGQGRLPETVTPVTVDGRLIDWQWIDWGTP